MSTFPNDINVFLLLLCVVRYQWGKGFSGTVTVPKPFTFHASRLDRKVEQLQQSAAKSQSFTVQDWTVDLGASRSSKQTAKTSLGNSMHAAASLHDLTTEMKEIMTLLRR